MAEAVFGTRLPQAERYADLLCTLGVDWGLIGPREPQRIWDRHIINSALLAELVPENAAVIDLGSGAGLPGIPLVIARPDISMNLLEPMSRRVDFLRRCVGQLGVEDSLTVTHDRATGGPTTSTREAGPERSSTADVVVCRAVAPLHRLIGLSAPLARRQLIALKGRNALEEIAVARQAHPRAKMRLVSIGDDLGRATAVVVDLDSISSPTAAARSSKRGRHR